MKHDDDETIRKKIEFVFAHALGFSEPDYLKEIADPNRLLKWKDGTVVLMSLEDWSVCEAETFDIPKEALDDWVGSTRRIIHFSALIGDQTDLQRDSIKLLEEGKLKMLVNTLKASAIRHVREALDYWGKIEFFGYFGTFGIPHWIIREEDLIERGVKR